MNNPAKKFSHEVRTRAVMASISEKIGCSAHTLNEWVKKGEVTTWPGFVCVAFVIDVFARSVVGWRVSRTAHAGFVLNTPEQAIHAQCPSGDFKLIHHSDRGSQYVAIRYTERLAEAGIEPSAGSVGDSYDNARAETINGLFRAEVIHRRGSWRSFEAVEYATPGWVDWFNNRRILEPIGNINPRRGRTTVLRYYEPHSHSRVICPNRSPTIPGRFTPKAYGRHKTL